MNFIQYTIQRFKYAILGVLYAFRYDRGYRLQAISIGVAMTAIVYFLSPFNQTEWLFLGLAYALILITELQNTAFEEALDHLHPELHDKIGRSKDMAGGAVFLAGLFLIFVLVMIILK